MQSIKLINGKEHQQEAEGCLVDTGVGDAHIISIVYDVQSIPNSWKTMNEPIKLLALTTWKQPFPGMMSRCTLHVQFYILY